MILVILSVFCLYFLLLVMLIAGWHNATSAFNASKTPYPRKFISVVIPFRNEKLNLPALITSLSGQSKTEFEVLLVDDHSNDGGAQVVRELTEGNQRYRLLPNNGAGKKKAITTGIAAAKGSIIVTTDADCLVPARWLERINEAFASENVKLVFGPVRLRRLKGNLFSEVQALEFMTVIATGAPSFQFGYPIYCSGANLAFQRDAFHAVGGYEGNFHVPSGDDEFLLRKVVAAFPGSVKWLASPDAIVATDAQPGVSEFFQQRLRWAGKWKYAGAPAKLLAVVMLAMQLTTVLAVIMLAIGFVPQTLALALLAKLTLEYVFLFNLGRYFSHPVSLLPFIILQAVYPLYVIAVGIFSNVLSFSWKGRRLRTTESTTGHF